ncbi:MAG: hypothetical protein R3C15_04875 [Thermoleophilia bacterium]
MGEDPFQPSLSWTATTAAVREAHAELHRLEDLVVGDGDVPVAEEPGGALAEDPGRLPPRVQLDDATGDREVVVPRPVERGGREPERVLVLVHQRDGAVADDRVERLAGRRVTARPVLAAPARPDQPGAGRERVRGRAHALERLRARVAALEAHLALRQRPGEEVGVAVGEAGQDAAPAEVDDVGRRERRLVRPDGARDELAGDRERTRPRQLRIHRADDAVPEDHDAEECSP